MGKRWRRFFGSATSIAGASRKSVVSVGGAARATRARRSSRREGLPLPRIQRCLARTASPSCPVDRPNPFRRATAGTAAPLRISRPFRPPGKFFVKHDIALKLGARRRHHRHRRAPRDLATEPAMPPTMRLLLATGFPEWCDLEVPGPGRSHPHVPTIAGRLGRQSCPGGECDGFEAGLVV